MAVELHSNCFRACTHAHAHTHTHAHTRTHTHTHTHAHTFVHVNELLLQGQRHAAMTTPCVSVLPSLQTASHACGNWILKQTLGLFTSCWTVCRRATTCCRAYLLQSQPSRAPSLLAQQSAAATWRALRSLSPKPRLRASLYGRTLQLRRLRVGSICMGRRTAQCVSRALLLTRWAVQVRVSLAEE